MTPFGEVLVPYLKARKLNQRKLAGSLKILPTYLSMILNGTYKKQPSNLLVERITEVLALHPNEAEILKQAAQDSMRIMIIPAKAPARSYEIAHRVMELIEKNDTECLDQIANTLGK